MRDQSAGPGTGLESVLIAHRGEPARYPENSLEGFRAALEAGSRFVETDVQLSADGHAVLSHDDSLLRVTGHDLSVLDLSLASIRQLSAGEPARFGAHFDQVRIATLSEFVALLRDWPDRHAFIELKSQSLLRYGGEMVSLVRETLAPIRSRCVLLSFHFGTLLRLHADDREPIGWVLPEWSPAARADAEQLAPEFLFVNRKRLPPDEPLWPGPWRWAIYTVDRLDEVERFVDRGFQLVETNHIGEMLRAGDSG